MKTFEQFIREQYDKRVKQHGEDVAFGNMITLKEAIQLVGEWQKLQQTPCSTLREFVAQMHSHVMVMKSRVGVSDSDERYISGQELICSLVLQEIDKLLPFA